MTRAEKIEECLMSWVAQYGCACGHPACKRCRDTREAEALLAPASGGDGARCPVCHGFDMKGDNAPCERCGGKGGWEEGEGPPTSPWVKCPACSGRGTR